MRELNMSDPLADTYTDAIHTNLKQYASWPVDSGVGLGDYGWIEGSQFNKIGNITRDFGIKVDEAPSPVRLVFEFKSAGIDETSLKAGASGSAPGTPINVNATAALKFAHSNSVYFRSIKLTYNRIDNFAAVGSAIMEKFNAGVWKGNHAFIHSLFKSGGTTIIVSNHDGAEIEIEAGAKGADQIDLADANLQLRSTHDRNVGLKVIASDKLVPLFGLAKVQPRWWWFPFLGGRSVETMLVAPPGAAGGPEASGHLPGHILINTNPELSPDLAKDLGKSVEEIFQVGEIP
jgi:hypothetical protein